MMNVIAPGAYALSVLDKLGMTTVRNVSVR